MCSIAGSTIKDQVSLMLDLMKHRSPDGTKILSDEFFDIGMGRLSIVDLKSSGLCLYEEGNYILSFNGEIYNYIELRKELEKEGDTFKTKSDIEVVLKSYKKWGVECLQKFNGMFALAIYDGKEVFLARDIAGEKPLYFDFKKGQGFRFASEAKALSFRCLEFPPAHFGKYSVEKKEFSIFPYWKLERIDIDLANAEKTLEDLLADSIKLRTRADVPYGLYFSGGIDSSLIKTFHNFKSLYTFTNKDDYKDEFLNILEKIVWHLDYPIDSFSPFGLWKLAEVASKEVKVVISGEGADELFGGYIRYMPVALYEQARKKFPSYQSYFSIHETVDNICWKEFRGNMRHLLRMGDRMASAFGIENRCPFLDKRIIQFAFSLPLEYRINGFDTKYILRKILQKRNKDYKFQEKMGLFCSVNEWIGSDEGYGKKKYLKMQKDIWEQFQ